ncbi:MAG: hypothetical protein QMB29_01815, partial [Urechidicola sp.]
DIPIMKEERILEQEEKKQLQKETERKLKPKIKQEQRIKVQDSIAPQIKDKTLKIKTTQNSIIPPSKIIEKPLKEKKITKEEAKKKTHEI